MLIPWTSTNIATQYETTCTILQRLNLKLMIIDERIDFIGKQLGLEVEKYLCAIDSCYQLMFSRNSSIPPTYKKHVQTKVLLFLIFREMFLHKSCSFAKQYNYMYKHHYFTVKTFGKILSNTCYKLFIWKCCDECLSFDYFVVFCIDGLGLPTLC